MNLSVAEENRLLAEFVRRTEARGPDDLCEFVPWVHRHAHHSRFIAPRHLRPLADVLERATREQVELVVNLPPRHAKTDTILHWISWVLLRDPTATFAYVSYADEFAQSRIGRARRFAELAGVQIERANERTWRTPQGGLVKATGILGQLTGEGFRYIIVDDPHKNREEAESPTMRRKVHDAFTNDIYTRQDPLGTSVIVVHTRWHPDDLAGRLQAEGFPVVNLPAISAQGEPLWPAMWPLERLERLRARVGEYAWESLYMGRPRPRGSVVFDEPTYYDNLPDHGMRVAIGVDLAYTRKTSSDWSVAVALERQANPNPDRVRYYVVDVLRRQCRAPEFALMLKAFCRAHSNAQARWYASGTEIGSADFLVDKGVRLEAVPATGDKFVRAQPVAAAWNAGRVLLPREAPWLEEFRAAIQGFTGISDDQDDEVDALAAAFDQLESPLGAAERLKDFNQGLRALGA